MYAKQSKRIEFLMKKFINDQNFLFIVDHCTTNDILQGQNIMVKIFNSMNNTNLEANHEWLAKASSNMYINGKTKIKSKWTTITRWSKHLKSPTTLCKTNYDENW